MTAVPETPPGAISDGARKTVSDTTINIVPAVISRKDCAAERRLVRPGLAPTRCLLARYAGPSTSLRAGGVPSVRLLLPFAPPAAPRGPPPRPLRAPRGRPGFPLFVCSCAIPRRRSSRRHHPHGMWWKRKRLYVTDPRQVEAAFVEGVEGELGRAHAELDANYRPQEVDRLDLAGELVLAR